MLFFRYIKVEIKYNFKDTIHDRRLDMVGNPIIVKKNKFR